MITIEFTFGDETAEAISNFPELDGSTIFRFLEERIRSGSLFELRSREDDGSIFTETLYLPAANVRYFVARHIDEQHAEEISWKLILAPGIEKRTN